MTRSKWISIVIVALAATPTLGQSLINGDFETGDETGWTQTPPTTWGDGTEEWLVDTPNGPIPPGQLTDQYSGQLGVSEGSFGWWQVVAVTPGADVSVEAQWTGADISWAEVMLFDFNHAPTDDEVNDVFGPGPASATAFKKDKFGMNSPTTWSWEAASLSPHPDGNGGTIAGSCGWIVVGLKLGSNSDALVPSAAWDNVEITVTTPGTGSCTEFMAATSASPPTWPNDSNVTLQITGTNLHFATAVRLVPVAGGDDIIGTNRQVSGGNTLLSAEFATDGAIVGIYTVAIDQDAPCCGTELPGAFELTCAAPTTVSGLDPVSATDPAGVVQITISGQNVIELDSATLAMGTNVASASTLTPDGQDLIASFDLSCMPSGIYTLGGTRDNGCPDSAPVTPGDDQFTLFKTPVNTACGWQPWAGSWSNLNKGPEVATPPATYNPTNWDYFFSQDPTVPAPPEDPMTMDTPSGSGYAMHWFLAPQPPDFPDNAAGSGGIFQEIAVTPDVAMEYSYWWKGAATADVAWFEFLIIDGPFSVWFADQYQEGTEGTNNPFMLRKKELTAASVFEWEQVQHTDPPVAGPHGDRPTTMTPTGSVVTVVLKAGRNPAGGMEALFDDVVVTQSGGANLVTNGDFEDADQTWPCSNSGIAQDLCESDQWRAVDLVVPPPCPEPQVDTDDDGDVDHLDFARFQVCYTGSTPIGPLPEECRCFDDDEDDNVDSNDWEVFEGCGSGPEILADTACGDTQACMKDDLTCQDVARGVCELWGDQPLGQGTSCSGNIEACCLTGPSCEDVDTTVCSVGLGGTPQGPASECLSTVCP